MGLTDLHCLRGRGVSPGEGGCYWDAQEKALSCGKVGVWARVRRCVQLVKMHQLAHLYQEHLCVYIYEALIKGRKKGRGGEVT